MRGYKIFAGTASSEFAKEICSILDVPLAKADVKRFSDRFLYKSLSLFVVVMSSLSNQQEHHQMTTLWNCSS